MCTFISVNYMGLNVHDQRRNESIGYTIKSFNLLDHYESFFEQFVLETTDEAMSITSTEKNKLCKSERQRNKQNVV